MPRAKEFTTEAEIPGIFKLGVLWVPDDDEVQAAWELYVELITRVAVAELGHDQGSLREALTSIHSLFGVTRDLLRKYGPVVAKPKGKGELSFGLISVRMLNNVLRPFLAQWHPALKDWEARRPEGRSSIDHERAWQHASALRDALEGRRLVLNRVAGLLANVAQVPLIHEPKDT